MKGGRPRAATLGLLTLAAVSACTSSDAVTAADKRETASTLAAAMTALSDATAGGDPPLRPSARDLKQLGVDIPPPSRWDPSSAWAEAPQPPTNSAWFTTGAIGWRLRPTRPQSCSRVMEVGAGSTSGPRRPHPANRSVGDGNTVDQKVSLRSLL